MVPFLIFFFSKVPCLLNLVLAYQLYVFFLFVYTAAVFFLHFQEQCNCNKLRSCEVVRCLLVLLYFLVQPTTQFRISFRLWTNPLNTTPYLNWYGFPIYHLFSVEWSNRIHLSTPCPLRVYSVLDDTDLQYSTRYTNHLVNVVRRTFVLPCTSTVQCIFLYFRIQSKPVLLVSLLS